ncbi:TPA: cysteine hydrolase, partial [Klebsiella pneumoniae]|nr:cysteine hydrolase [Klebsiella pneumoniae]
MPQEGGGGFPLIAATRTAGVPVIYVSVGFRKGYPEVSKNNTIFAS